MIRALLGPVIAFGLFALAFALHIVGGATDQAWLFAVAVALIFAIAAAFPVIAYMAAGSPSGSPRTLVLGVSFAMAVAIMAGTLWAANDRSWAVWTVPASFAVAGVATAAVAYLNRGFEPASRTSPRIRRSP